MLPPKHAFLCVVLALTAVTVRAEIKPGDPFPALGESALVSLDGSEVPQLGGKVTLVDFWASWCAPCKASFPAMARLHADYQARGLQIVAISVDEKPAAATAFWKKMAPPFSALHDKEQKLVQQVAVPTMPTSYLIGRDGKVRAVHIGFRGDLTQLRREIEELLDAKGQG